MISIIISSVEKHLLDDVSANIEQTIGVPFEILAFDNRNGEKGICEIYNIGASSAKYDMLCFMHEDVAIKTENWGVVVLNTFKQMPEIGLLGLAGSKYKTLAPSGFYCHDEMLRVNIIQKFKYRVEDNRISAHNPDHEKITEVVSVDGAWFCCPKTVALNYPFDEGLFKGFHCYDIDFSLGVRGAHKVAVTFEILLAHFSEGNYDRQWVLQTLIMQDKWRSKLPISLLPLSQKAILKYEKNAFRFFLERMSASGFSKMEMSNVLWKSKIHVKFGWNLLLKLQFFIFKT